MFRVVCLLTICFSLFKHGSAQQYGTFKDSRDGRVYKTVKIRGKEWMVENLNVERFRNGAYMQKANNINEWKAASEKKIPMWCYLDFDDKNAQVYGKYYNWFAATDERCIAPEGWHVPNSTDWLILIGNEIEVDPIFRKFFNNFAGYLYDGDTPPWFFDKQELAYFWSTNTFKNESVEKEKNGDWDDDDSFIVWFKKGETGFNIQEYDYCSPTHGLSILCVKNR